LVFDPYTKFSSGLIQKSWLLKRIPLDHVRMLARLSIDELMRVASPERDIKTFIEESSPERNGVIEGIITFRSSLNEHTMGEFKIKELFRINPLAVMRGTDIRIKDLGGIVLKPGDAVLLYGAWDNLGTLQEKTDLVYTEKLRGEEVKEGKAWLALAALATFLLLALALKLPLSVAGLVAPRN
jgi:hypothetical protein